ncbi:MULTISPECIES: PLP-dependent aminotransferase family protein [unclassified Methylocystis]|uniref:MocR-like pyridoxine biosynthesis transcription factor PdxR n=1 Tax=unclassified Methylocystis TaxID=2625913 RepID=UPI0019251374|nr:MULTISPECIES: PLP-dependent aminotransferase family protein [unclassified Methylocystis]MBL1258060.1 PLP-dependent aminotransferase family protein [Methylocystis sp. Sn-Cys]MDJ0447503.1 PLP-dependent aminotransferase family protein [Methylocystis sp. JR02]
MTSIASLGRLTPVIRSGQVQLSIMLKESDKATLQTQIFDQIRAMILNGRLRGNDPLPTTRELSAQLGVSRNTAVLAYERLVSEGYIRTKPYVGTFVAPDLPDTAFFSSSAPETAPAAPAPLKDGGLTEPLRDMRTHRLADPDRRRLVADFWVGKPDARSFPLKAWSHHIKARLKSAGSELTTYSDPAGLLELRQAIAKHLAPARGVVCDPEQIIIVGGCQDGFNLVGRLLVTPGSPAVVESPCYQGAAYVLESLGAKLHPVPIDRDGLDVTMLPQVEGAVAYVTPSHQYPVGVTLSLQRRIELLAWATQYNAYIMEDDYDSDFRFVGSPLTALKGLDRNERVIYLGTFSKCMGPGLRLGYVVAPRRLVESFRRMKMLMNNGQSWLEQAAMADFMSSGEFGRHLRRIRQMYRERRDALLASLHKHFGECEVYGEQAGMHLVWKLPDRFPSAAEVEAKGLAAGVGVCSLATGSALRFDSNDGGDRLLMLGFVALTEKEIEEGIARLATALRS